MKILITGAAGSIGSELVRQLYKDHTIYALDINETGIHDLYVDYEVVGRVGDIRNYETVNDVFSDFQPEIVYHAAAYKHVEPMEVTPLEAIKTNVIGSGLNLTGNVILFFPILRSIFLCISFP